MNHLEHFAEEIRNRRDLTVKWIEIRNLYFREGSATDGMNACEKWAKENNFYMTVDYEVESFDGSIPSSIRFEVFDHQ